MIDDRDVAAWTPVGTSIVCSVRHGAADPARAIASAGAADAARTQCAAASRPQAIGSRWRI